MQTALTKFIIQNSELTAVINNNRLKSEHLTQKEVANFAFEEVYSLYEGKLPKYKNLTSNDSLIEDVMKSPEYYSKLE